MNILAQLHSDVVTILQKHFSLQDFNFAAITIELPKNSQHGDFSCNAAMVLARPLKQNPQEIAAIITADLSTLPYVQEVTIAGAGFLNFVISKEFWLQNIKALLSNPKQFLQINLGNSKRVNVEYASPNPTGPMHIGHARGAIFGEVLANLLIKCGYSVDKEYYINDAGNQITLLVNSLYERYKEALGLNFALPEDGYPGEYLKGIACQIKEEFGYKFLNASEHEIQAVFRPYAINKMMHMIKTDMAKIGVYHNVFTSELHDVLENHYIEKGIAKLREQNLIYEGVLDAPKGKKPEDWEERKQLLYRSTEFGDDVDRPLQKSDGSYTYLAGDIGYHLHKLERGYDIMVLTLGADHAGYVKRLTSCVNAMDPKVQFTIVLFQLVKLLKDGQPFKMSKRAGNFITVDDVLNEIDADVLKFMMLTAKSDTTLEIDFSIAMQQSKENPVFYVQYAHTRASSILRKAKELSLPNVYDLDVQDIIIGDEIPLLKLLFSFHKVIISAAESLDPIKLVNYLQELAATFHSLWNVEHYKFIDHNDVKTTAFRVAVCQSLTIVMQDSLSILNIEALEYM